MPQKSLIGKGSSPKKFFRVDKRTEEILDSVVNQSEFIRNAIAFYYERGVGTTKFYCEIHKRECKYGGSKNKRGWSDCPDNPFDIEFVEKNWGSEELKGMPCPHRQEKIEVFPSDEEMIKKYPPRFRDSTTTGILSR